MGGVAAIQLFGTSLSFAETRNFHWCAVTIQASEVSGNSQCGSNNELD